MSDPEQAADVRKARLAADKVAQNFSDMHPPLSRSEALIAADRCYFCYAAPCTTACPTGIDIPRFIQGIRSDDLRGAATAILEENIMGGMCARVCPTEVLCEEACVRNTHEDKPVDIGLLQRYATDPSLEAGDQLFARAASTGKRVAVVGGGPAGLACAHRLAMHGHAVTVFCRDEKLGGLNEYGIAAYKTVDDFARREARYILGIGGIDVKTGASLGGELTLDELRAGYDAVFLGFGLAGVNRLDVPGEQLAGVVDAVAWIAQMRQAPDKGELPVGRRVIVIGGGMTAIDVAVQNKRLGAEQVTLVYRRGQEQMPASSYEQEFAQANGVLIRTWAKPLQVLGSGHASAVEFEGTRLGRNCGKLKGTGEKFTLEADVVFKAIGQEVLWEALGELRDQVKLESGRIAVDDARRTSLAGVWAGGDCVAGGKDLTVAAVQDGKLAAEDIHRAISGGQE